MTKTKQNKTKWAYICCFISLESMIYQ